MLVYEHEKILFLLVFVTFVIFTQQQIMDPVFIAKYDKMRADCATEDGLDLAEANKAWDDNKFPNDPKLKCFYKCLNLKLGVIDQTGEVVDEALGYLSSQFSDRATKDEIVAECGPIKGADLCETSYLLVACVKNATVD